MAFLVAVGERFVKIVSVCEYAAAVCAGEGVLLGVVVDALAAQEVKLCLVALMMIGIKGELFVSELKLLAIGCHLLGFSGSGGLLLLLGSRLDRDGYLGDWFGLGGSGNCLDHAILGAEDADFVHVGASVLLTLLFVG